MQTNRRTSKELVLDIIRYVLRGLHRLVASHVIGNVQPLVVRWSLVENIVRVDWRDRLALHGSS